MVSRATVRARSAPFPAMIHNTSSEYSPNSCARLAMPQTSSTIYSISGAFPSKHPIPAERHPVWTHSCVFGRGINFVQIPHRTLVRIAGIGAAHARRVGLHRL